MKKPSRDHVRESALLIQHVSRELCDAVSALQTGAKPGNLAKDDILSSAMALEHLIAEIRAVPADRLERIFAAKPKDK